MSVLYLLDAGPLSLATNPKDSDKARACKAWLKAALLRGDRVTIPEVADYELRRDLLRAGKTKGLARLDALAAQLGILPAGRAVWLRAAELWAAARNEGRPTAPDLALDGDAILAATAIVAGGDGARVVVVTTNVGHLSRFVEAADWQTLGSP